MAERIAISVALCERTIESMNGLKTTTKEEKRERMKCVFHRNTLMYRQNPVAHKKLIIFRGLLSRLSRPKGRDEH